MSIRFTDPRDGTERTGEITDRIPLMVRVHCDDNDELLWISTYEIVEE